MTLALEFEHHSVWYTYIYTLLLLFTKSAYKNHIFLSVYDITYYPNKNIKNSINNSYNIIRCLHQCSIHLTILCPSSCVIFTLKEFVNTFACGRYTLWSRFNPFVYSQTSVQNLTLLRVSFNCWDKYWPYSNWLDSFTLHYRKPWEI